MHTVYTPTGGTPISSSTPVNGSSSNTDANSRLTTPRHDRSDRSHSRSHSRSASTGAGIATVDSNSGNNNSGNNNSNNDNSGGCSPEQLAKCLQAEVNNAAAAAVAQPQPQPAEDEEEGKGRRQQQQK
jgi:hypothetical protein